MLKEILEKKEVEFYSIEIQLSQIFVIIIVGCLSNSVDKKV